MNNIIHKYSKGETLASIAIALRPSDNSSDIPKWLGDESRRAFYRLLSEADEPLCDKVHNELATKPFTASSLIRMRGHYQIRFTMLMPELYNLLIKVLLNKFRDGYMIELGNHRFEIDRLVLGGVHERFATVTDYRSLWNTSPRSEFSLRFVSPTSFRVGKGHLPFPLPNSVYNSLLKKWNQFAPPDLIIDQDILQTIADNVFPARHAICTALIEQEGFKLIGFVGRCRFEAIGKVSEERLHQLAVLTEYAYYAGVGMRTTQGMGQVLAEKIE